MSKDQHAREGGAVPSNGTDDEISLSPGRAAAYAGVIVAVTVLLVSVIAEIGFRAYLFTLYVIGQNFPITTMDVRSFNNLGGIPGTLYGYYQPHKPITFTSYDNYGNILQRHTTPINNFGWPSEYDYQRAKPANEYRIAVVGDSMTASINNARPWPDALQRHLNKDRELLEALKVDRITVLNIGVVGAGLQFMANPLARVAVRYSPDLLMVNFIGDDLRRRHGRDFTDENPAPVYPPDPPSVDDTQMAGVTTPDVVVDGAGLNLYGCPAPRKITNPECKIAGYVSLPYGVQLDEKGIDRLKSKIAWMVFWDRVGSSLKPLLLLDILGRPAVTRPPAPPQFWKKLFVRDRSKDTVLLKGDIIQTPEAYRQDVTIGVRAIKYMKSISKDIMLVSNPMYWLVDGQMKEPELDMLQAALNEEGMGLEIVRGIKYLPTGKTKQDWYTWYNLPHDGHWSDVGAEIYGEALAKAVRERVLAKAKP